MAVVDGSVVIDGPGADVVEVMVIADDSVVEYGLIVLDNPIVEYVPVIVDEKINRQIVIINNSLSVGNYSIITWSGKSIIPVASISPIGVDGTSKGGLR